MVVDKVERGGEMELQGLICARVESLNAAVQADLWRDMQ